MTFKDELKALLLEEIKVYEKLQDISYEKTDVLIEEDTEKLSKITIKEEGLVKKIQELERKRQALIDEWGMDISMTLSEIIGKLPEGSEEIEGLGIKLLKLLEDIGVRNKLNAQLLNDSIEWVNFNVNLLAAPQTQATYKKDDKTNISDSLFDRKV